MSDSRKGPEGALKRDLLATLAREVHRWEGREQLGKKEAELLGELMSLLERCPLYLAEWNWLSVSRLWLTRATLSYGPDDWLREIWLLGLWQWQRYLECFPMGADEPPAPPSPPHYSPEHQSPCIEPESDPDRTLLPFGFVKPVM